MHDPFDPESYPGKGWPVVLPDLNRPGRFAAHRAGCAGVVGYGKTELDALEDLLGREDREGDAGQRV